MRRSGQPAPTPSGGEARRSSWPRAAEAFTGRVHPRRADDGLHFDDIRKLLNDQRPVDKGNTVIVIEHNLVVIKHRIGIIDLGPGGGGRRRNPAMHRAPEVTLPRCRGELTEVSLRSPAVRLGRHIAVEQTA